ncbi:MAG: primosomal protein N' [Alphaproteobacteria bacterium]|nr:primosomal protein N' [Alphaproteobacteria bacterium]
MVHEETNLDNNGRRCAVLLPLPLERAYDYGVPEGLDLMVGSWVAVPLGGRSLVGVVWGPGDAGVAVARLRDIAAVLPAPPMAAAMRRFIDWVAAYTLTPAGAVLRMAMSIPEALTPAAERTAYVRGSATPDRLTPARSRVLALAEDRLPREATELAREAGVGTSVVKGLAAAGALQTVRLPARLPFAAPDALRQGATLSGPQAAAATDLMAKVRARTAAVTLLDGVTGAGKTEVYFEAIAAAVAAGRQALVLLPEIALGAQWLARFYARFGCEPAQWHSDLTGTYRRHVWRATVEGKAPVVVGARSALFLPFPDLGLIVVDEEHDGSYKQEDGAIYQARDMAVVRGRLEDCPVVLASATPALETVANVAQGRYQVLRLPDRHGGATMPTVSLVDMRQDGPAKRLHWLSASLKAELNTALAAGEQGMLFLNRRGYAPLTLCRACGHRLGCPNCQTWLVEHRLTGRLQCHHCGYGVGRPNACPACGVEGRLAPCGPGVERLSEEVAAVLPDARVAVMTSDTVDGPRAAAELVRRMTEREIDVLIGTQIVAKGHHFPWLTVVGVVDGDLGLAGGDLRATERTFQLLHQVVGRAGRAERPGRALVQTYRPDHPVMLALASGDRDRFIAEEMAERREHAMPPFSRLAAIIVSGAVEGRVRDVAQILARAAPRAPGIDVLGPAPAPLALLKGRARWRLLVRADRSYNLQRGLREWLADVGPQRGVRLQIDVDPYSFL